ncbi:degV domain-containing protein spr0652 [Paraliobacillus ryukyuensis]|uniref:DegV family protein with EDD domain n=1 Tax=Paraliobacillus ryukyuensis TaxID=200904 RepID=A0A366EBG3_9BACI|nr:DegV family protein [Paraliobacillus ryukyuensis]RBO99706.1 DegV family protein with EDD domain [Paraliobacillus ryukyuensis]
MQIQLMTDSSADLPKDLKQKLQIITIPLFVHFGNEQYTGEALDTVTLLEKIEASNTLPRSSAPGPHEYYQAFKACPIDKPIILLGVSEGISSAYNHAKMGRNMLLEEEPNRKIAVINTKTASPGLILLLNEAADKIAEGYGYEQLVTHLEDRVDHTITLFVLRTLDNLIRGGRLDKVKGAIAKTLNIKLLLHASDEGKVEVLEKVRGDKKALRHFVDQIGDYISNAENKVLAMTHCNAKERAEDVLQQIKQKYSFKQIILSDVGPVIATHTGEGGLVISFFKDK